MQLTEAGDMIWREWLKLPGRFPGLTLEEFVVMPNHIHGLLTFGPSAGPNHVPPPDAAPDWSDRKVELGRVVGAFKSITTHAYIQGVLSGKYPEFNKRLWQRNYYECIIDTDPAMANTRIYIQNNPSRWAEDHENPSQAPT